VKLHYTARRHPQANPVERMNKTIVTMLRSYVTEDHKKWDSQLQKIACALRTAESDVTKLTPYYLTHGREMVLKGSDHGKRNGTSPEAEADRLKELPRIFREVKDRLARAHRANAQRYNLRRRPQDFNVGDIVWKRNFALSDATANFSAKLAPKFTGPYKVKKKVSTLIYELEDQNCKDVGRWHVVDLKPYV
jgi:hypothetical protein